MNVHSFDSQGLSPTLGEGHRLSVLRKIFGPKREEVAGEWRRLHNEELHNLYASKNIIRMIKSRRMRWMRHVARMREINTYSILVSKPKGKRPFGRSRRRWEDTI
jgi:hypothetical protein